MNWLDIIILVILAVTAVGGFLKGLIKTVFSLVGLIVGIILAGRFYILLADRLTFISSEDIARIVAFILIFLIVLIIAALLGFFFTRLFSAILLGWLNRLGGAAFGVILGSIFIAAILAVWAKYAGAGSISDSAVATFLLDRFPLILTLLPAEFKTIREFFQ